MLNVADYVGLATPHVDIREGTMIHFDYNGVSRVVEVEKVRESYVQGRNIPHNGDEPKNAYATYSFSKMESVVSTLVENPLTAAR
jgi:hypothetical protein